MQVMETSNESKLLVQICFLDVFQSYREGAVAALGSVKPGGKIGSCSRSLCSAAAAFHHLLFSWHSPASNPLYSSLFHCSASPCALHSVWLELAYTLLCGCHLGRGELESSKQADARSWISQAARTGSQGFDTRQRCSHWSI